MSSFLNDPEAQARYEELFGKRAFSPGPARVAIETPNVVYRHHVPLSEQTPEVTASATDEVVFAERSERYAGLRSRLQTRGPASTQGDSTSGGSF